MRLSQEAAARAQREYDQIVPRLTKVVAYLSMNVFTVLKSARAREYLSQGLCRRINIIRRCVENVFAIFPPDRVRLLSRDELSDVQINLHAFVVNVYGVLDNLAWVYVTENGLENELRRNDIGLFSKKTQGHLPLALREYLTTSPIATWFNDYAKNFRDALAHRIPLYVPPAGFTKDDEERWDRLEGEISVAILAQQFEQVERLEEEKANVGMVYAAFLHSLSDVGARPVQLHAQMLSDALTVLEVTEKVAKELPSRANAAFPRDA